MAADDGHEKRRFKVREGVCASALGLKSIYEDGRAMSDRSAANPSVDGMGHTVAFQIVVGARGSVVEKYSAGGRCERRVGREEESEKQKGGQVVVDGGL